VPSFGAHNTQHGQSIEYGQVNSLDNLAMQQVMLLLDHFLRGSSHLILVNFVAVLLETGSII